MTGMAGCVIITLTDLKFFIYFRHFCRKYAEPKRKKTKNEYGGTVFSDPAADAKPGSLALDI